MKSPVVCSKPQIRAKEGLIRPIHIRLSKVLRPKECPVRPSNALIFTIFGIFASFLALLGLLWHLLNLIFKTWLEMS